MRLTVGTVLSLAAFGFVGALTAEPGESPNDSEDVIRLERGYNGESPELKTTQANFAPPPDRTSIPLASFIPTALSSLIPGANFASLIPINVPTPIASLLSTTTRKDPPRPTFPLQNIPGFPGILTNIPGLGNIPNIPLTSLPKLGGPKGPGNPPPKGSGNPPKGPGGPPKGNPSPPPPKNGPPKDSKDQIKCTNQEVSCDFLRKQAFDLQNDDDECLRIATSFDDQGKINIQPIAQGSDTVVYGITTDGLTASAWCNDIGWTLRRIYAKCRRGKTCYGGQGYAARNAVFMVSVGPKSGGPKIINRYPNIEFYDTRSA